MATGIISVDDGKRLACIDVPSPVFERRLPSETSSSGVSTNETISGYSSASRNHSAVTSYSNNALADDPDDRFINQEPTDSTRSSQLTGVLTVSNPLPPLVPHPPHHLPPLPGRTADIARDPLDEVDTIPTEEVSSSASANEKEKEKKDSKRRESAKFSIRSVFTCMSRPLAMVEPGSHTHAQTSNEGTETQDKSEPQTTKVNDQTTNKNNNNNNINESQTEKGTIVKVNVPGSSNEIQSTQTQDAEPQKPMQFRIFYLYLLLLLIITILIGINVYNFICANKKQKAREIRLNSTSEVFVSSTLGS